ncbi:MAG: helix-turn-helix domain-containing protein [Bacteroidales bacterium]|nr:helix-turn-helix domain-containing protein [Bacteroidales bacterium]MDD2425094.1 helix-turn-helix domain-containing protein [Bacteroidales bacterium]MDD3988597.1 helix-turn-helix domain-containing protein [Bacteroidales bacterium]
MIVKFHTPGKDFDWIVRQYQFIYSDPNEIVYDKFIPREDVALVFHLGSRPHLVGEQSLVLPPYFLTPIKSRAHQIRCFGNLSTFIVLCNPTVLSKIFSVNMDNGEIPFLELSAELFLPLWEKLVKCETEESRINCFQEFITGMNYPSYKPDTIDCFYHKIINEGVRTPLSRIENSFDLSERTLQRKFRIRTGVTPKTLIRIVRINHIWNKLKKGETPDYQNIVFEGNYFDQTHFIKDFKAITGETPDCFFKRDLFYAKSLSGKQSE